MIGVGGILDADDAARLFDAGASLVQLYTGFIYRGPALVRAIARAAAARPARPAGSASPAPGRPDSAGSPAGPAAAGPA